MVLCFPPFLIPEEPDHEPTIPNLVLYYDTRRSSQCCESQIPVLSYFSYTTFVKQFSGPSCHNI